MNFELSEEQDAVRGLAEQIFAGSVTVERVKEVEATDDVVDRALWGELADAGLLGIALPEEHGGSGLGVTEVALVLEQQGRTSDELRELWDPEFWERTFSQADEWDKQIEAFNEQTGVLQLL